MMMMMMMRIVAPSPVPPSHAMRCSTCSVVRGSRRSPRHRRAAFWSVLQPSHLIIIIIIITVHSPDRLPRVWAAAIIAASQALGEVLRHAQVMSRLLLYLSSIYHLSICLSSIYRSSIYLSSICHLSMGMNHHPQYNLHGQEVGMDPHPQRLHGEGEVLQSDRQPVSVRSGDPST